MPEFVSRRMRFFSQIDSDRTDKSSPPDPSVSFVSDTAEGSADFLAREEPSADGEALTLARVKEQVSKLAAQLGWPWVAFNGGAIVAGGEWYVVQAGAGPWAEFVQRATPAQMAAAICYFREKEKV